MNLPGIDFVSIAAGYGLPGRRVSNAVDMADALKAAIDAGKPSLLEVEVEPSDSGMFQLTGSVQWNRVLIETPEPTGERKR
jgi:benzoylformate decarboxylase